MIGRVVARFLIWLREHGYYITDDVFYSIPDERVEELRLDYLGYLGANRSNSTSLVGHDDRPECCKDHNKFGAVCNSCEFGE